MSDPLTEWFAGVRQRVAEGEDYEVLEDIPVRGPNGDIAARMCMVAELYYPDGHRLDVRLKAASVMRDYFSLFPEQLHYYMRGGEKKYDTIKNGQCPDLDAQAKAQTPIEPPDDPFGPVLYDAVEGDVRPYRIASLNQDKYRVERHSFIEAYFAFRWAKPNEFAPLINTVLRWAAAMRPAFGLAGPGFRTRSIASDGHLLFPLIRLVPGLEYTDPVRVIMAIGGDRTKIKGMNWLTVLHDRFIDDLGGAAKLRALLEPECTLHAYPGGIVIQAGPRPEFGDSNLGVIPAPYRKLARLLDPILFDTYRQRGLFPVPSPLDAREAAAQWVHRFNR